MMSQEFIDKLLIGSRKLHQLQQDIDQAVRILLGLIQKDESWKDRLRIDGDSFYFKGGRWQLGMHKGKLCARLIQDGEINLTGVIRYSSDPSWNSLYRYAENVSYASEKLPELAEQLLRRFPQLKPSASMIIDFA